MEEEYDPDNPSVCQSREDAGLVTIGAQVKKRKLHGWRRHQPLPEYGDLLDKLTEYIKRHAFEAHNEVEVRLGKLHDKPRRFEPGVSANMFSKIMEHVRSCQIWEDETVSMHTDYFYNDKRLRVFEEPGCAPELVSKRSLVSLDVLSLGSPFDFRFSVSKEKEMEPSNEEVSEIMKNAKVVRHKERISFAYKVWLFDLTIVRSQGVLPPLASDDCFDDTSEDRNGGRVYEVELELNNVTGSLAKTAPNAFYLADATLIKVFDIMNFVDEIDVQKLSFSPIQKATKK